MNFSVVFCNATNILQSAIRYNFTSEYGKNKIQKRIRNQSVGIDEN